MSESQDDIYTGFADAAKDNKRKLLEINRRISEIEATINKPKHNMFLAEIKRWFFKWTQK